MKPTPPEIALTLLLLLPSLLPSVHAQEPPSPPLTYTTSWIGNSFSGVSSPATQQQGMAGRHVQDDVWGMAVSPDGTCYTNSPWDEAGEEAGIYKNGEAVGNCGSLHGWGRNGGSAIALDDTSVYVAITQNGDDGGNPNGNGRGLPQYPPPNNTWYCVRRYTRAGAPAPFAAGYGYDGSLIRVNAGSRPNGHSGYSGRPVSGVAVGGGFLYVSDPTAGRIKKYSLAALSSTPVSAWVVPDPGAMTFAGGFLYVIQGGATPKVLKYSPDGAVSTEISFAPGVKPSALAFATRNGIPTLFVVDRGLDQDIKEYGLNRLRGAPTKVAAVFGAVGGIYSGKGAQIGTVGARRFNDPTGVGVDAHGNVYVSQDGTCGNGMGGGGTILESYAPNKTRLWQLLGLEFVDCADGDPASEADVYTKEEHFVMNYARTTPGTEAAYRGYTVNRFKYPEDPRLHLGTRLESSAWVREYHGHKFLITTDMLCTDLIVSRFHAATDGECAIPSTVFGINHQTPDGTGWPENEPAKGEWIWRDANGNGALDVGEYVQPAGQGDAPSLWGWWVDSNLDVWEATQGAGIRRFACQGLDSQGNPIYDYGHVTTAAMPSQFKELDRTEYDPTSDTMYLSGFSAALPNASGDWGGVGRLVCRYDHWSTNPTLHTGYPIVPPYNPDKSHDFDNYAELASLSVAGRYLFVTYSTQNKTLVYEADTGSLVATLVPGTSVGLGDESRGNGHSWTDIRYGVRAYRRADGEYEVFNEDDLLGKIVLYRWTPGL